MNMVMNTIFFLSFQWGVTDVTDRLACDVVYLVHSSHIKGVKAGSQNWVLCYITI